MSLVEVANKTIFRFRSKRGKFPEPKFIDSVLNFKNGTINVASANLGIIIMMINYNNF